MGFFGKLFEKKSCDICGGEIGMLGNRKLDDGNLCKNCAKELSPWFSDRRHSMVEEIRQQLADREENKKKVQMFQITRNFKGSSAHVFIDDQHGWFAVATRISVEDNPDILELSQVTECRLDVNQNRTEEYYEDKEGKKQSYQPPRYKYSYDYKIQIGVRAPWFDEMRLSLTTFSIPEHERGRILDVENLGNQIVAALTQRQPCGTLGTQGQSINSCGQQQVYQHGYSQPMQNQQPIYQQPVRIKCNQCGWMPEDLTNIPKFCPFCGDPIDWNDQI